MNKSSAKSFDPRVFGFDRIASVMAMFIGVLVLIGWTMEERSLHWDMFIRPAFKRNISPFPAVLNNGSPSSGELLLANQPISRQKLWPESSLRPARTRRRKVLPDLVSVDAERFKQIDYGKLPMLTIQAVKELKERSP